jgi:hypothetical protein
MHFETHVAPLDSKLPRLSYRWDAETDILTASCKASAKGRGLTGTIDLEGTDGAFVVLDVADGALRGVDVVNWPDEVPEVDGLTAPRGAADGRVTFSTRRPQRGVAAVEVDTTLQISKSPEESVFHVRVGRARAARPVRVADNLIVEVDRQDRLAGLWLLQVPPFPNVESGD